MSRWTCFAFVVSLAACQPPELREVAPPVGVSTPAPVPVLNVVPAMLEKTAVLLPPPPPPIVCKDVEMAIGLKAQIAANANATKGRYPIVLSHGFAGFDKVGPLGYFGRAPAALRADGYAVYVTAVSPMAPTETVRGPQLAHQLACIAQESGSLKLNLVGHSQGGIDVRWVATSAEMGKKVASVTSISTPHHGVIVGDMAAGLIPGFTDPLLDAIGALYGVAVGSAGSAAAVRAAATGMSTTGAATFNAAHPDVPNLPYFSWAGRSASSLLVLGHSDDECIGTFPNPNHNDLVRLELSATFAVSGGDVNANDGLVTVSSAKWGTFMGCVPADHLDEVGMFFADGPDLISKFDHVAFFRQVADTLVTRGL